MSYLKICKNYKVVYGICVLEKDLDNLGIFLKFKVKKCLQKEKNFIYL